LFALRALRVSLGVAAGAVKSHDSAEAKHGLAELSTI